MFFVYLVWWDQNVNIFQDRFILPELVAGLVNKLAVEFRCGRDPPKIRKL
jgi:hypothetical protein